MMKSFLRFAHSFRRFNRFSFITELSVPTCQTKDMPKLVIKLTEEHLKFWQGIETVPQLAGEDAQSREDFRI